MKKAILLFITTSFGAASFAQHTVNPHVSRIINQPHVAARTTAAGDTLSLHNTAATDTLAIYTLGSGSDSGYLAGTNVYGDKGFAERYDFNGNDSSMKVIGVISLFGGTINPSSSKTINFKVWDVGNEVAITSSLSYSGFPHNSIDTLTVPVTHLGIAPTGDTIKSFFFANPTDTLNGSFFVGYDINYSYSALAGDTLGLFSNLDGERMSAPYTVVMYVSDLGDTTRDTIINVQNATQYSDNNWHDNYTDNDSLYNNLTIYPIVIIGLPTAVKNVTRNNLTFYGNYPNPAVNSTNIKFALAKNADVSIQLMDMKGQILKTIQLNALSSGEHIVPLQTDTLPSGNYIYLIRTSDKDGIAGQMTIAK